MEGSSVAVSSAQAYVDSLAAAFNSASLMASSAYAQQAATPVCLPLTTGGMFEADQLQMIPPAPSPLCELADTAAVAAAQSPADTAADPSASITANSAESANPAAVIPPGLAAAVTPAAAASPPVAPVVPAAGLATPAAGLTAPAVGAGVSPAAVLPSAALLSNAAALQAAAAAGVPTAAAVASTPPTLVAVAANNAAVNAAAANAAAAAAAANPMNFAAANFTAANAAAAALNPSLAAAAASPTSLAAFNAANAPLLMAAGLSTATALMPTGATPAQLAAGMPAVHAVPVMVSTQPPSQASSLAGSTITGSTLPDSTMPGSTGSTATTASTAAANSQLSKQLAAAGLNPTAMGLTGGLAATGAGGLNPSFAAVGSPTNNTLAGLIAQSQALSQAAAAMPSAGSEMSIGTLDGLKSASVASSVLSAAGVPGTAGGFSASGFSGIGQGPMVPSLGSIPAAPPSVASMASTTTSGGTKKVRMLLSSGGEYEELTPTSADGSSGSGSGGRSVRWRYVGGETRLVGLTRTASFSTFLQQLSKATTTVWDEGCRLMYDLPGPEGDSGVLVDLIDDEDLDMMWEEYDSYASVRPGFKLHIYAQLGSKNRSTGGSSSTCASGDSHYVKDTGSVTTPTRVSDATAAVAAAAAAALGSSSTNTTRDTNSTGLTSAEYDELVGELVSDGPNMNLADLEAKLEIIKPDDLTPVRLLGTGGFGEVYLCRWHSCDVAVKCLNPNLLVPDGAMGSISKDNVSELLKEASILGSVRHPNVVWVYGLVLPPLDAAMEAVRSHLGPGQDLDAVKLATAMANRHRQEVAVSQIRPPALVTEYLASGSLRAAITRRADFLSRDSVRIKLALDAARGMDYLHSKHIVHFDLKTANLLVGMRDKTPVCKVADMGLSKQKQQTFVTGVATLRGTLPWIAPEIIKTPATVTQAVDVYSFGVVLWELWTQREPFDGLNYHALLHMMSSSSEPVRPAMPGTPEFDGECGPEPSPGWSDLISECLHNNPDERPTFRQIVERLESMLRANRMAKRRTASSPAAGTGTCGAQQATAGSLGAGSLGQAE